MRKGSKEEAMFWYKKEARAGNKEVRNLCKRYHVKY